MTQEALKKMYQLLLTEPHAPTVCAQLERIAREALADHAMRETQRLGQEIEQEPVAYYLPHKGFYWAKPTSISAPTIADVEPLPLYTAPPQRKPLTDRAITQVIDSMPKKMKGFMVDWDLYEFARAIEAKPQENT